MEKIFYIGIDDTDILEGPGTGKIARGVASRLEELGLGRHRGVIRHQLLVDPRIPYTSHNSAKCVLFETSYSAESLSQPCIDYLAEIFNLVPTRACVYASLNNSTRSLKIMELQPKKNIYPNNKLTD